uniref:dTMP kinase n=1 Tax=Caligus rogercresseyi TaxID=217165 RepID=C1BRK2_CALRO|nr:Thymidylate kinase [Caligus rogercresseyi]|eukprot:TRINITY_DN25877_c0_g1_i1.p1 TRINITY_DN25877_c0_g1~~TRINITY_DN25877_c0_g1_i1.p1  ORF type:complete len:217 (+),score=37.58 TRINITY_DN25877_c0_g1_i1:99-749(+)
MSSSAVKRGAFIVLEGCDRSGKTTIAKRLSDSPGFEFFRFPDRDSPLTGSLINSFLTGGTPMSSQLIHLLFSANRWEKVPSMLSVLSAGKNIICDRYAYSGIAYSSSKPGMDFDWCAGPDNGLPTPDLVIFLDVSPEQALKRGGFGEEVYEKVGFQAKVRDIYTTKLVGKGGEWKWISTDGKTLDDTYCAVKTLVDEVLSQDRPHNLIPLNIKDSS